MRSAMLLGLLLLNAAAWAAPPPALRVDLRRQSFNDDWHFRRGDASGAERAQFDDSKWASVRLPHDWAIGLPFDAKINPHTGALPISGIGWYRKQFVLPAAASGRYLRVDFDGAMANATVWLNGHKLGERPYGYSSFGFDLTPWLHFDGRVNVLAVRLHPEAESSRWYPGAGIYRNVWLEITGPVQVAHWGTAITYKEVSAAQATVFVRTELANRGSAAQRVDLRSTIVDASGMSVWSAQTSAELPAQGSVKVPVTLRVEHPALWDPDHPNLYTLQSELIIAKHVVDSYSTPFGIRQLNFDVKRGLSVNGQVVRLHGVCLHHDLGALGAAVSRRATERQLQILKAAGVNAIRTSHNPPSPELLEFADRLGFLVMDEAFDEWRVAKVVNGYHKYYDAWSERDLRDMVRRDRNHPSIIMWSIGNEIPEQGSAAGKQEAHRLTALFHDEDPTRPTTSAFNNWKDAIRNGLADEVDIPGFNYAPTHYADIQREHPGWIIYGSETASCVSSRGVYHLPLEKYEKHISRQLTSYDLIAPYWAYCPDVEFAAQQQSPAVLGEFVWTGFDYIGEPTPFFGWKADNSHDWPARSSYFGMVDLAGFPKDRYYLYQSQWTSAPMVHLLPHWNWPDRLGQPIPVMVYSNADEVELFLNGKSLGSKRVGSEPVVLPVGPNVSDQRSFSSRYRLLWQVPYAPGTLLAIARRAGSEVARDEVRTAGAAARIRLQADRADLAADGDDLAFITARVEDANGNLVPDAGNLIQFKVSGAATIAAVDNGNAATVEAFQADQRHAFSGQALLIVRARDGEDGTVSVVASSDKLASGTAEIHTHASKQ